MMQHYSNETNLMTLAFNIIIPTLYCIISSSLLYAIVLSTAVVLLATDIAIKTTPIAKWLKKKLNTLKDLKNNENSLSTTIRFGFRF